MIAVAVALGFTLLGPPSSVDVLFPNGDKTARLRVMVTADGRSPEVAWRAFLDRLFNHFDRDGNGLLSQEETGRVVPLPVIGGEVKPNFARMDADRDGKVTPAEFREFYRSAGFTPIVGVVTPPPVRSLEVAEALFVALDRDGDNTLSAKELKAATDLLRRFDENEDDELSEAELLAGWTGKVVEVKAALRVVPSEGAPDALFNLGVGILRFDDVPQLTPFNKSFPTTSPPHPVRTARPWAGPINVPGGRLILVPDPTDDSFRRRPLTAKELVAEQFAAVGGKPDKPIPKSAVEGVRTARAVAAVFDAADRDGDGKLTAAELTAFIDLVEDGARCQVVLELRDGGKSLFDLLNRDGSTLARVELERAAGLSPITRADVPATYRLAYRRRTLAASFAGMPLVNPSVAEKPAEKEPSKAGPKWFRAMDRNGDGVVAREEFVGRPERFAALDKDGDGRITVTEAENPPK